MESKPFDDLKPNPKNPRRISEFDFENLKKSIMQFGDLSGIVFNLTTKQLVGGHQRIEAFKRLSGQKQVIITKRLDEPDKVGTVAYGWITHDNQFYAYREVQWPPERETAANIAANRIEGEFDLDLLAEANYQLHEEFPELLIATGQSPNEIDSLLDASGGSGDTTPPPGSPASPDQLGKLTFKFDPSQAEVVRDALYKSRISNKLDAGTSVDAEALYLICQDYLDKLEQAS